MGECWLPLHNSPIAKTSQLLICLLKTQDDLDKMLEETNSIYW